MVDREAATEKSLELVIDMMLKNPAIQSNVDEVNQLLLNEVTGEAVSRTELKKRQMAQK